jgi:hypothetical protein
LWGKPEYPEKTTDLSQVTVKLLLHNVEIIIIEWKMLHILISIVYAFILCRIFVILLCTSWGKGHIPLKCSCNLWYERFTISRSMVIHNFPRQVTDWFMVFNAIFNNIAVISWRSVLLVEETGLPRENHRPVASHWQTFIT